LRVLVLDSGGVTRLAARNRQALSLVRSLVAAELWPPVVPTVVLVESLQGHPGRDANVNRFLKTCIVEPTVTDAIARRAAELRRRAGRGSAVDAIVVAVAEPHGTVLTGDEADLGALSAYARQVTVERI
jgi:predicted nucleic acid-binding protein